MSATIIITANEETVVSTDKKMVVVEDNATSTNSYILRSLITGVNIISVAFIST